VATTESSASDVDPAAADSGLRADELLARLAVPPAMLGIAVSVALIAGFVLMVLASGAAERALVSGRPLWENRDLRLAIVVGLLAGYLPVARRYQVRSAARARRELEPRLAPAAPDAQTFRRLDGRRAAWLGVATIAFVPFTALLIDRDPGLYFTPGYWRAETWFSWTVGAWVGFWLGTFAYVTLAYARRFSRLAASLRPIDLLDLGGLAPFARHGLSSALQWLVLLSIVALNALDVAWFVATAAIATAAGVAALTLPVQGLHRRLRAAKHAELDRIRAALREEPGALRGSPLERRAGTLSIADLLAWRGFVESVREWPFDAFTIVRFGLYLAIPLGSWLGGAFVERLLGAALD
jgi:hypothetical protein